MDFSFEAYTVNVDTTGGGSLEVQITGADARDILKKAIDYSGDDDALDVVDDDNIKAYAIEHLGLVEEE